MFHPTALSRFSAWRNSVDARVKSYQPAPTAQRGTVEPGLGFLGGGAAPEDLGVRVPGEPRVVEDGALNQGEPHGKEAEHQAAGQGEAQLGDYHGQTRAAELVELRAAVLRGAADTFVVDNRPGGIAADQLGAPEELWEQVGVPSEAAEDQASQRQGKRPGEEVAPPVEIGRAS